MEARINTVINRTTPTKAKKLSQSLMEIDQRATWDYSLEQEIASTGTFYIGTLKIMRSVHLLLSALLTNTTYCFLHATIL